MALLALPACRPPHSSLLSLSLAPIPARFDCGHCCGPLSTLWLLNPEGPEQEGLLPSCFPRVCSVVFSSSWEVLCVLFGLV